MNITSSIRILPKTPSKPQQAVRPTKKGKRVITISISKRQKFVIAVICLTLGLFLSGSNQIGKYAFHIALTLAFFTDIFLLWVPIVTGKQTECKANNRNNK